MPNNNILILIVCIVVSAVVGFLIGRHSIRAKGEIVFEPTYDENNEEIVKCIFKLDLDIDEIIKESYILFNVSKDKRVLEIYSKSAGK